MCLAEVLIFDTVHTYRYSTIQVHTSPRQPNSIGYDNWVRKVPSPSWLCASPHAVHALCSLCAPSAPLPGRSNTSYIFSALLLFSKAPRGRGVSFREDIGRRPRYPCTYPATIGDKTTREQTAHFFLPCRTTLRLATTEPSWRCNAVAPQIDELLPVPGQYQYRSPLSLQHAVRETT